MSEDTLPPDDKGATVVITHRVQNGQQAAYEQWLQEISPLCQAWPGYLDTHIVQPIADLTDSYTIIIRFDQQEPLRRWMASSARARLIDKVQPLLAGHDDFHISSGLDFWFAPTGAKAKLPVRWKQALLTWSAIFPLVLLVPPLVRQLLLALGLPAGHLVVTLLATACIVFLMVYVVMPRYTRLVHQWLFR